MLAGTSIILLKLNFDIWKYFMLLGPQNLSLSLVRFSNWMWKGFTVINIGKGGWYPYLSAGVCLKSRVIAVLKGKVLKLNYSNVI